MLYLHLNTQLGAVPVKGQKTRADKCDVRIKPRRRLWIPFDEERLLYGVRSSRVGVEGSNANGERLRTEDRSHRLIVVYVNMYYICDKYQVLTDMHLHFHDILELKSNFHLKSFHLAMVKLRIVKYGLNISFSLCWSFNIQILFLP